MINNKNNKYENKIITIPNIITLCRLIIIIFAGGFLIKNDIINSFVLYLIAIITDFLDGFLARGLKQISKLGKILDPLVDKLMIGSAIIILICKDFMPVWYGVIVISCFLINIIGGLIVIKKFNYVPSAIFVGKVAAVFTMFTFLINIPYFLYTNFLFYMYIASASLLITSVGVYVYKVYKNICNK